MAGQFVRQPVLPHRSLSGSWSWPLPSQDAGVSTLAVRQGIPWCLLKRSQGCLKLVRPAKPLKPGRDLRVIQVQVIAAAGADQFIHVGVATLDTAVHDAHRLVPQDRIAAMTALTGGRECHVCLRHDAQPPLTAVAGTRGGEIVAGRRAGPLPVAGSEPPGLLTHNSRSGSRSYHYRGLEQRRCIARSYTRPHKERAQPTRTMSDHVEVQVSSPVDPPGISAARAAFPGQRAARV